MSVEQARPIVEFLQARRKGIVMAVLVIAVAVTLAYRFLSSRHAQRLNDFIQAEIALEQLAGTESEAHAALSRFDQILGRHRELHHKYDGPIAQKLLNQNQATQSEAFIKKVLHRADPSVSQYAAFSETSLLIAQRQYEEALDRARILQHKLDTGTAEQHGEALRLNNLIRIAFLCQELNRQGEEEKAWIAVIAALEAPHASAAQSAILNAYRNGDVSILDYAHARLEKF